MRFWWVASVALFIVAAYLFLTHYLTWRRDSSLIVSGVALPATIVEADGSTMRERPQRGDAPVVLVYEYQGHPHRTSAAFLEGREGSDYLYVGSTIPIRVDPNDPGRWTWRVEPVPLGHAVIGAIIAFPVAIILLLASLWQRSRILRTWRDGSAVEATVLAARHTALAPRAWSIRCTSVDSADKRVFTVFAPPEADVNEGASVLLLALARSGRPVLYEWLAGANS